MKTVYTISAAILIMMLPGIIQAQNVFPANGSAGIGTAVPDASSILEVKSTTKGILIPRMTKIQRDAIVSPATGLMIYQTTSAPGFYYYDGSAWNAMAPKNANKSLSNLTGPTAINVDLLPATDASSNLGSVSFGWKDAYLDGSMYMRGAIYMNYARFISHPSGLNTFMGYGSGASLSGGAFNTGIGDSTLTANTTGSLNTANGFGALTSNSSSSYNSAFGAMALNANTIGYYNTANGAWSLFKNTTGSNNTAFGSYALQYNVTADYNTAIGAGALSSSATGYSNTAVGYQALFGNLGGDGNTASGISALYSNTTGYDNSAFGNSAGAYNDANSYCSFFGFNADQSVNTDFTNSMALGNTSRITASNQVRIGNSNITSIGGYANWTNISDGRFKKNLRQDVPGLAFINKLKPVTYNLDITGLRKFLEEDASYDKAGKRLSAALDEKTKLAIEKKEKQIQTGFVAQDVEKAAKELAYDFSGVDKPENESSPYGLRYSEFVVPLVKAVQELSRMNDEKNDKIDDLQKQIDELKKLITANAQTSLVSNQRINSLPQTGRLEQNQPNPTAQTTVIKYFVPEQSSKAAIRITNSNGQEIKSINISAKNNGQISIQANGLIAGTYLYSLIIDGKTIDTKKMVIIH
jgi:hypothetical protein